MNQELLKQFYDASPESIRSFINSEELDATIIEIALNNRLPITGFAPLKNAAVLVLLGATKLENIVTSIKKTLSITEEEASRVTQALNNTIFERARGIVLRGGESVRDIKIEASNSLPGTKNLRGSLLDASNPSVINNSNTEKFPPPPKTISPPGSRTELMVQLELIGQIPKDNDVLARLETIKKQLEIARQKESRTQENEEEVSVTDLIPKKPPHPYYPKEYALDPYREIA